MATGDPAKVELEALLLKYREAQLAVAAGKSYSVDGLTLERQDLPWLNKQIALIRRELIDIETIEAGGNAGQRVPVWN